MDMSQQWSALLNHWEGCRHYSLDYTGLPSGKSVEMVVEVKFDAPAKKQFRIVSEDGSRFLLNQVLKELLGNEKEALGEENRIKTPLTPDNYEFRMVGTEETYGRPQYVLEVTPRFRNKFLYQGKIWVDAADFAVTRISAEPAKNPPVLVSHTAIEHRHSKVGKFWLPASNSSVTKVRSGGTAKLSIDYVNYRIGISNSAAPATGVCSSAPREVPVSGAH
jgi:hypothetical protein